MKDMRTQNLYRVYEVSKKYPKGIWIKDYLTKKYADAFVEKSIYRFIKIKKLVED